VSIWNSFHKQNQSRVKIVSAIEKIFSRGIKCGSGTLTQTACHTDNSTLITRSTCVESSTKYNNTHSHWCQQETDNNNTATMATAVFVTEQQPTINIIISITKIVLNILVDDAVLMSSLIIVSLLKGTIWLNMVSTL
jgi:hypothetical protein